ncbi:transporter substrate-binding domain-containing protein [Undibacterium sp. TS12]|uniref:substrate-binding periplasmic protein n=1 Tax=Undibacterium sp. TS12 TaxID=2908202 RepID=UPI001F4CDB29|nr:transporter substrate-binding domain-containing protein [Undibacterium sp. TS12]MCH8618322.1 transporter substrate-binding domain-containing protein [Undibacterium sp. TS12]
MCRSIVLIIFGFLVTLSPPAQAVGSCERIVISADPAYPPLHWHDGQQFHGASILILTRILNDLGLPYEVRYLGPWKRVLSAAQSGGIDMITTLKSTPERRSFLLFSELVLNNPVAAFARKDKPISFSKWEDLSALNGGIARGNRFGLPFDDFMDKHLNIKETDNLETAFRMLQANRFDYVITGYHSGQAYLASANLEDKLMAVRPFLIDSQNLFGMVAQSPCVSYLPLINRQLEKLHKEAYIEQALMQARAEWRASPVIGKN